MPTFTYNDSPARKPYEEPGEYVVTVENYEFKYASSGNEMLVLQLRTENGALIYDNLVFTEKSMWKIDHALKTFLPSKGFVPPKKGEPFDMNEDWVADRLLGATGSVILGKRDTPQGKTRNEVDAYVVPGEGKGERPDRPTTKPAPAASPASASSARPAPTTTRAKPTKKSEGDEDENNRPF